MGNAFLKMRKSLNRYRQLNLVLVFGIIYFSLIYPYTHFHRSHNIHSAFYASTTKLDVAALDNAPKSQNDHQSHHLIDEHVGVFCKTSSQTKTGSVECELFCQVWFIDIDPDTHCSTRLAIEHDRTQPQLLYRAFIIPRSPPHQVRVKSVNQNDKRHTTCSLPTEFKNS